ncbi:glycosyltransferase [Rhodoferax sp. U2-2l]|uniref:glycosyltransferase n=1 Tax=Rhodoferax sp. U2-2l TaxID=2884000 RepID=UPI001D0AEF07|nr:glycosyltransferase [Rhodoferax sp. U2-2l]MCB8747111.1 glycosyltransferase [Rhodoferax sp. U2-2l]
MNHELQRQPNIAICLAAYNGVVWLPEQMNSILKQMGVNVTVFVSVDRSTDGTELWCDKRAHSDSRIVLLPHGERFGGASRNFFRIVREVDFSEYDYVSFADQDDIWLPHKLLRAHEMLSSTGADAYSSNVTAFWLDGRMALIEKSHQQVQWDFLFEAAGPGCTYVMRKELACAVQDVVRSRWDEMQDVGLHDWFIYAFARANGCKWFIDDVSSMLYRQHESNQVGVNAGWRAFMHRADKVLSGWGLAQSALIARLVGLNDDPFVSRWAGGRRLGLLYLALQAGQCRRRSRDKFIFGLSSLVLSVTWRSRR